MPELKTDVDDLVSSLVVSLLLYRKPELQKALNTGVRG